MLSIAGRKNLSRNITYPMDSLEDITEAHGLKTSTAKP